jgi:hypothetical protein
MTRILLTVPEPAEALAISRSKLYELLAAGDQVQAWLDVVVCPWQRLAGAVSVSRPDPPDRTACCIRALASELATST